MIERKIVAQKLKEFQIQEYMGESLKNSGQSHIKVQRTPMGEKIVIYTSRPGMIVGRKGQNIKKLTIGVKKKFDLENPQIEISEVENPSLDPQIIAERIVVSLERFGAARFKGIVHKVMEDVMNNGAFGVEIVISGKVPSARAKSWRFSQGYMKKCGDIAQEGVSKAYGTAKLKSGVIGIKIKIMPPTTKLPDRLQIKEAEAAGLKTGKTANIKKSEIAAETGQKGQNEKAHEKKAGKTHRKNAKAKSSVKTKKEGSEKPVVLEEGSNLKDNDSKENEITEEITETSETDNGPKE